MSDWSSPRPTGGDLFFANAADQSVVSPDLAFKELVAAAERQRRGNWITWGAVTLVGTGMALFFWRRRKAPA